MELGIGTTTVLYITGGEGKPAPIRILTHIDLLSDPPIGLEAHITAIQDPKLKEKAAALLSLIPAR